MTRGRGLATRAAVRAAVCAAAVGVGIGGRAAAQAPAASLEVGEVLERTLRESPDIRTARAAIDLQRGVVVQTANPFDPFPSVALSGTRTVKSAAVSVDQGSESYASVGTDSQFAIAKLFRSGVSVTSRAEMTRTATPTLAGPTLNQLTATASIALPMLQGRGGSIYTATEQAASSDYTAARQTLRGAASRALLAAATAYWQYRAAAEQATIQRAATSRAQQALDELKILIAADERPRSDIDLMVANAATKQAAELDAERQVVHARYALGLAIGIERDAAAALPPPGTPFPDADTAPLPVDLFASEPLAQHDEYAAAQSHQHSAWTLRDGTIKQLMPRFDLVFSTGYTGQISGGDFTHVFGAVFSNVLGPNASVQFVYVPSSVNSLFRGELIAADAAYAQAAVATDNLARSIRINVADAVASLNSSSEQLALTREAVERSRLALETMERNFELGTATLFDRILAEDTVTNAERADVTAKQEYATALVNLQYARGVLIGGRGTDLAVDPDLVLHISTEEVR